MKIPKKSPKKSEPVNKQERPASKGKASDRERELDDKELEKVYGGVSTGTSKTEHIDI